jgi:crotonobetainyl-CoA:carnitine CoA-transferase CaiB-like acyl-CoA transferase
LLPCARNDNKVEFGVPLSGIRVVDLTRILAGPFCTMILADMGAEVVKVEPPGAGDPLRAQGVIKDGLSWYFAGFNRNKRSLSLNLRSEEGKAVLARLIAGSDVLVENYRSSPTWSTPISAASAAPARTATAPPSISSRRR